MFVVVQSTLELRGVHKVISYGWCMHGSHFVRGIQILHCMLQHLCPCHHYIFLHLFFIYLFLYFLVLISATARTIEVKESAAEREVPCVKSGWPFIRFQLANYVTHLYKCLEPLSMLFTFWGCGYSYT